MGRRQRSFVRTIQAAVSRRYLACFPEPTEVRLLELCGGITFTIGRIKREGKPFTIILSQGKLLRSENFKRVAFDNRTTLYVNDIKQAIIIQGNDYEHDVLKYFEQEEQLLAQGFRIRYIPQRWLESNPLKALQSVQNFIYY